MRALILEARKPAEGVHVEFVHASPCHNCCVVRVIAPDHEAFYEAVGTLASPFYDGAK